MLSNWSGAGRDGIAHRLIDRVMPGEPVKNRIEAARRKLDSQISKMDEVVKSIQRKDDHIFEKLVNAQKSGRPGYAQAYAAELAQVRRMKGMVTGAKLSMEQVRLRLDTVSELGDVVVTLSPCMSIIRGLGPSLNGLMPEANASMQDLSQAIGEVMEGSSVQGHEVAAPGAASADTLAILEEAQGVIAGQARSSIPDVPESLKQQIVQRRGDVLI